MTCARQGAWFVAVSDNFQVCSLQSAALAEQMAQHCEQVRADVTCTWCAGHETWTPKCQVILHRTTRDYVRAVGAGSETTLGSSLVKPATGTIRTRRIDLRTDVHDFMTAALPHEMCHVVLADHFREQSAPLWFDEGVALQYDPPAKQRLHQRDLHLGMERGAAFTLPQLVTLERYPPADQWGVFYGQSAALVRILLKHGTAPQLLACVKQASPGAMMLALRNDYRLQNWGDLQQRDAALIDERRESGHRLVSLTGASTADGW